VNETPKRPVGFAAYLTVKDVLSVAAACFFGLGLIGFAVAVLGEAVFAAGGLTASALAVSAGFAFTTGFGASGHTIGAEASLAAIRSGYGGANG